MIYRLAIVAITILALGSARGEIRPPAVAGSFYPADSATLATMVRQHLDEVSPVAESEGELIALIVPHAGLVYSGAIAAYGYRALASLQPATIILCGPSHRYAFEGLSVYGPGVTWRTPLGSVACDADLCTRLIESDGRIRALEPAHRQEHSLEVQLPYLQVLLDDFTLVPIVMGRQDRATIDLLGEVLTDISTPGRTILVAATDWQHFKSAADGWPKDSLGIECVRTLDGDRLERLLASGGVEACGGGPTAAVLRAAVALGGDRVKILKYGDSGDISGDKSSVVGYLAAAIYRSENSPAPPVPEEKSSFNLTPAERQQLLEIARKSIEALLHGAPYQRPEVTPLLKEPGAAFVTLTKQGRLRGCIGYTRAVRPLAETVAECAVKAATEDPRFPPVSAAEFDGLHLEISVLTPLQPIVSLDEIEVGRDGLMMVRGNRSGLLLPQVATDYGWTRIEFLENTCRKAGLPDKAYLSPDIVIYRFQALVFGEKEP